MVLLVGINLELICKKKAVQQSEEIPRSFQRENEDNHDKSRMYSLYVVDIQAEHVPNKFKALHLDQ
jgi:hypothetical protein